MQIIIPMTGEGTRFARAGYSDPKPLIPVHGKPIIEWVMKLFPGENNVLFICRDEHLDRTRLREVLQRIAPRGKIVGVPGIKKGPVYAVSQAFDSVDNSEPAIISYCDYYMHWDYPRFRKAVLSAKYDGAIPCYTGFHPHLLRRDNYYANCRVDKNGRLIEIREKHSFTSDKLKGLHSSGTYYFGSGALVKKYFKASLDDPSEAHYGEYYVSLVYNRMVRDACNVHVPVNVTHFCQWGTPEDLKEYLFWVHAVQSMKS